MKGAVLFLLSINALSICAYLWFYLTWLRNERFILPFEKFGRASYRELIRAAIDMMGKVNSPGIIEATLKMLIETDQEYNNFREGVHQQKKLVRSAAIGISFRFLLFFIFEFCLGIAAVRTISL